ncbi:uncharacterized protein LOC116418010 [Nasonia vitripennis]|uniref:Transposase domain-containing protein n=1 Tax=Nasonia vitripennis TaxID=7425 RepID=A0A7M7QN66_NASVI|nr:uncharacterized protein LOC116418010 [Nasonia vitripennis]
MDMVRCIHDESTQWEVRVDGDSSDTDNGECKADYSNKKLLKTSNFNDLLSNPKFLETITTSVDKSPGEIFLILLKLTLLHKLPLSCTSDLFRLVNCIFKESVLPETSYMLDKILNTKTNIEFFGICPNCEICVGKIETFKSSVECDICSFNIDLSKPSLENIFLIIDPSEDITNSINLHSRFYNYVVNERKYDGSIKDIYDGKLYREFVSNLQQNDRSSYVTAILNTDGAPTFECSKYSIWPIYIQINEIPIAARLKSSIVCGMWFGKKKPPMNSFLQPLVNKLNELSINGIECNINNVPRHITLHVLIICVDSVARAPMQCHKQFNGKYGCSWCLHPGEWFEGSMRYPILVYYPKERRQEQTVRFMEIVTENEDVQDCYGVKGVSPLINLNSFDIVSGFVPDYMHCYLAGVGKQITECILQKLSIEVIVVDKILKSILVPQQLARFSRPLSDRNDWKAKEWENFILHYSIPLFKYLLEDEIVEYWTLLVNSLYILLKDCITMEELDNADRMLHEFNLKTEKLFTKKAMTFNVHQLLHISASVYNWGPLWSHSTFPFESANHHLLQTIHCANGVNLQIVRYLNYQKCLNILENRIYPHASPKVIQFCKDISQKRIHKSYKIQNVTYLGNTSFIDYQLFKTCIYLKDLQYLQELL